jgi:hypothetical protein
VLSKNELWLQIMEIFFGINEFWLIAQFCWTAYFSNYFQKNTNSDSNGPHTHTQHLICYSLFWFCFYFCTYSPHHDTKIIWYENSDNKSPIYFVFSLLHSSNQNYYSYSRHKMFDIIKKNYRYYNLFIYQLKVVGEQLSFRSLLSLEWI